MSLVQRLIGNKSKNPDDYAEAKFKDQEPTEQDAEYLIKTVRVMGQSDVLTVKDELFEGNIVFMEIPSTSQVSEEYMIDEVKQAVDQVGGDIAYRNEEEIIVAPNNFFIVKERQ